MLIWLPHDVKYRINLFHLFPALSNIISRYLLFRGKLLAYFIFSDG